MVLTATKVITSMGKRAIRGRVPRPAFWRKKKDQMKPRLTELRERDVFRVGVYTGLSPTRPHRKGPPSIRSFRVLPFRSAMRIGIKRSIPLQPLTKIVRVVMGISVGAMRYTKKCIAWNNN